MPSNLTVDVIAEQIASKIQKQWPEEKEAIYNNLSYVQDEIWSAGKFYGSTQWWHCHVYSNGTLKTPHGHNVLLGIDINGKPREIRDKTFLFHKNGPGDVVSYSRSKNFDKNVIDLGEQPVVFQPTDTEHCGCVRTDCEPKWIYIKSACKEDNKFIQVSGLGCDGEIVYTYEKNDEKEPVCQCTIQDQIDGITVIEGVRYPILAREVTYRNIKFSRITNIVKEPTQTPVEVWAVGENGIGIMIARLEPFQVLSRYRIYQVPPSCSKRTCVLGLFKKTKPERIISDKQIFISSHIGAITSLAIAMDFKYDKLKPESALPYIQDAAIQLNAELRENQSQNTQSIQMEVSGSYQNFPKF